MSTKSGLAANRRYLEVNERITQLCKARSLTSIYSESYWHISKQIDDQFKILASCTVATNEAFNLNHTTGGDFTHLAAVGSVRFYRGAHA